MSEAETEPSTKADPTQSPTTNGAAGPGPEAAPDPVEEQVTEKQLEEPTEIERVTAERDQALAERSELLDRFQRAQAEFENFRKRLQRESEDLRQYAAMSTIESLLPVVDDFERALSMEGLDEKVREGLHLIHKRLFEVFTRAGLKPMNSGEGEKFDPGKHHAVDRARAESEEDDQKILEVYQHGYFFKDRLLRPAMVKVAVKD